MKYLEEFVLGTYQIEQSKINLSNYPVSKGPLVQYFHFQRLRFVDNLDFEKFVGPFRVFALVSAHVCFEDGLALERKHSVRVHLANNFDVTGEFGFDDSNTEISDIHSKYY